MSETARKELVQRIIRSLLDIQILRLIQAHPMWGYSVKKHFEVEYSLKLRHGALYPLLNEMERRKLLTSQKQQHGGRTRRVYSITGKGREWIMTYEGILKEQISHKDIK